MINFNRCIASSTGNWMPGISKAMGELATTGRHDLCDPITDGNAAKGLVAIGYSLRKRNQIGFKIISLTAPPLTGATKAANDFIADYEHVS